MKRTVVRWMAAGIFLSACAWAQDAQDGEDTGRGVARISVISGDVSVRRGDSGDWVAAAVNAPLVVEDNVLTGVGSRAEVQFDYANFLRLGADAEVRLAGLETKRYQIQISRGTATFRVLRDSEADVELDTPNVSVRPSKRGIYRVTVNEDGTSEVTVRSGEAETFSPKGAERLHSGKTMLVRGTQADPEFQVVNEIAQDNFDRWSEDRDRLLERSRTYQYVSRDIYGADELDSYGRWVYVPSYGWVWSPSGVGSDWAPYRYGRWAWVDWYGWSWVSYDPWGWAPYHYGRWFNYGSYGWCWYPGQRHYRHYWSPALVGFFGFGHGVGVGIGFGSVGWVPLAPHERYYPWYGRRYYGYRGNSYDNRVIINNTNITNVYRNARVVNGVTGVDTNGFAHGGRGNAIHVSEVARQASLVRGPIPVPPVAASQRFSDRAATVTRARTAEQQRFYTHSQPARVERISFEDQRRGAEQFAHRTVGAPLTAGPGRQAQPGAAGPGTAARTEAGRPVQSGPVVHGGAPAARTETGGAWRRVQQEPRGSANRPEGGNWRQFGGANPSGQPNQGGVVVHGQAAPNNQRSPERNSSGNPPDAGRSSRGNPPAAAREQAAPRSDRSNSGGDWRRFGGGNSGTPPDTGRNSGGNPPAATREQAAPRSDRSNSGGDWRQFGGGNSSGQPSRTEQQTAPRNQPAPRQFEPRSESGDWRRYGGNAGGSDTPRYSPPRSNESVRINAPIVRERSAPSSPRMERAPSSMHVERGSSAPARSSGGGGGGGGARSGGGGGGGGGGRSSGGGGGHSRR